MTTHLMTGDEVAKRRARLRAECTTIRHRAQELLNGAATAIQAAAMIATATDEFLLRLLDERFECGTDRDRFQAEQNAAIVAVGGSGRGEMAPFSDVDLLFVCTPSARSVFVEWTAQIVRDCWDAGMHLGHSIRTVSEALADAQRDPHFATSLIDARRIWGSEELVDELKRKFARRVVRSRIKAFLHDCITGREQERYQHGAAVQQLEPDVKRSFGGLRDFHLIRWIGFAQFETTDVSLLYQKGGLTRDDVRQLVLAHEYLTRIRFDLHFAAGKSQDVLTRDEQQRIADERGIQATAGQLPVECFMQEYFGHSTTIADITKRFVRLNRPKSAKTHVSRFLMTRRVGGKYKIANNELEATSRRPRVAETELEPLLEIYYLAALHRVGVSPVLTEQIQQAVTELSPVVASQDAANTFLAILGLTGKLGDLLRNMYETGVLERVVPEMTHARCLLQFNRYHSYTVDEHTLRAVEAAEQFHSDEGPVGIAYRAIRQKAILHLALLLHDLGKGYETDHSDVGRAIAEAVGERLGLNERKRNTLVFLVHKHLLMSNLAFRRDTSDIRVLVQFVREVGSPETLRMLFVLTAADLSAVGPAVWNDLKSELLASLYERSMLVLSGNHPQHLEQEMLRKIHQKVNASIVPLIGSDLSGMEEGGNVAEYFERQLESFSPHYLSTTPPERIARDLDVIRHLHAGEIVVEGKYDSATGTVDYRIIMDRKFAEGCFHLIVGVLTAKRLKILSAQINTSLEGIVVDVFRVIDDDLAGAPPPSRMQEVGDAIRKVLTKQITVKELFQRHKRFTGNRSADFAAELPTRIAIDNESSDRCTVVDVFAHDQPGLLYTVALCLFQLELSVELAKIATHLDQVVDVFYVTDQNGSKIEDESRLSLIRHELQARLTNFEEGENLEFL